MTSLPDWLLILLVGPVVMLGYWWLHERTTLVGYRRRKMGRRR